MIDLHCHIIPGVDDGSESLDESIEMCRIAARDGITKIVCTPHNVVGKYNNNSAKIMSCVKELQADIDSKNIPLTLYPGCEIHLDFNLVKKIKAGELMTMNNSGRYIILELPGETLPQNLDESISSLVFAGIIPIIAHPERNLAIRSNPALLYRLVKLGALSQLTTSSLIGRFGSTIEEFSIFLIEHNLVHMMATDAHSSRQRRPILSKGLKRLKEIIGQEAAMEMVTEIPEKILNGNDVDVEFPVPLEKKSIGTVGAFISKVLKKSPISA